MPETVLVTGARGYVGRTLVHMLSAAGHPVRALSRGAGDVRLPHVEVVSGDVTRPDTLLRALEGITALVHAARVAEGPGGGEPEVVAALGGAACRAGVRRFIHLSTTSVYRLAAGGVVDETAPGAGPDDPYGHRRRETELALLAACAGRACILQPGAVYGGHGGWWSGTLLDLMRRGDVLLPAEGEGLANLIHVADLAETVLAVLAAHETAVGGQRFIVTDGRPIPWREYYGLLEQAVGRACVRLLSTDECRALSHRVASQGASRVWRAVTRRLTGTRPVFPLDDLAISRAAAAVTFSPGKLQAAVGVTPRRTPAADWRVAPGQPAVAQRMTSSR